MVFSRNPVGQSTKTIKRHVFNIQDAYRNYLTFRPFITPSESEATVTKYHVPLMTLRAFTGSDKQLIDMSI